MGAFGGPRRGARGAMKWSAGRVGAMLLLAAVGCGGPGEPETPSGSLSVTLAGGIADAFAAEGSFVSEAATAVTFAAGRFGLDTTALAIAGFRARGGVQDLVELDLYTYAGAGTYPATGSVVYGAMPRATPGRPFAIVSGEVRIDAVMADRARGTFSGIAVERLVAPGELGDTVRLLGGSFDVPLVRRP